MKKIHPAAAGQETELFLRMALYSDASDAAINLNADEGDHVIFDVYVAYLKL